MIDTAAFWQYPQFFSDVDLCRSVFCGSESLSQLSSLGVFRVCSLDCGLSWAETGPAKGMYSTLLRDLEFIFGFFFSSNRYAKGTFNLPPLPLTPPPTPTPPHPPPKKKKKKKKQISFCYYFLYFDGCYDPQMAKNWKTTGWPKDVALDWSKSTDYFRRIFDLKFCFERYLIASCIEFWCLVVIFWRWIACIWTCSLLRFVHFVNTVSPLFTKNALFENFDKFIMSSRCQITQTSASGSYGAKIVPKK